ncbi:PAS domain S-box protein [Hydrogenophaga sp. SL48]|uniref:PAS domain S-box protein n=1 Tax=Hydrogenophaga sp. SL48 TaxID=2806347 RepID=UPI001F1F925A|nr:PAS domain S-box protein [Hydrogenophaga sp. SL48]UJW83211.1 PAS domain S-box protein [Hydrogenophaga sp. SL48]
MTTPKPPTTAHSEANHIRATLQAIALLIGVTATVLMPLVYLTGNSVLETIVTATIAGIGWGSLWLLRRGCTTTTQTSLFMVFGVMTAASLEILVFGSVRAGGGFVIVAAVAGAGVFLGRRALIGSVVYGITSLGLITLAEQRGLLVTPNFNVGTKVWVTHSAVLVVVAVLVFYSRSRARAAYQQQADELALRKRTEQERDRSMERFGRIFRTSPSPMVAQSARNGVILDVNPAFERCYGYTSAQVLGHDDSMLWAEPGQRAVFLQQLIEHRKIQHFDCIGLRSDGSTFNASVSSEMGNDPQDKLIITTIADVSAQIASLERLRRSEERFSKAFNFSPLNMTITRMSDGSFVEVNRTEDRVQGYQTADLRGKTTLDVGAWLDARERDAFVARLRREGRVNGHDIRMRHRDGTIVDTRLWAVAIDIDGEECILSCTVNISEEKRREALLLGVARGMTAETGKAFFGALTRHMALAMGADVVVMGELRADQRVHTLSVWKDGAPSDNFVYEADGSPCSQTLAQASLCVHENGLSQRFPGEAPLVGVRAEAYVGQSLRDEDGMPIGVLKALWRQPIALTTEMQALMSIFASRATAELVRLQRDREINHLNATLEQRVSLRTAELQKLNAELDSFAYSVSHDLKSPLRAIDGFTRLLGEQLEGRLQPDEEQLFERVLASTQRMSTLIADLLALARVSQGKMELVHTDLSAMAEQVLTGERARQPDRPLRWHIEPGLLSPCDARLARIALENLLGNAVKYTRDQPDPLIEVGRVPGTPGEFFVRDNGVGFNMAYADKLFKPFQRLHMPSEFEGTGIGLATVRRIVERHGGSISGAAQVGQGAEFRFSLERPCVQAVQIEAAA